jgi:uncharacterized membrane-anchored protein
MRARVRLQLVHRHAVLLGVGGATRRTIAGGGEGAGGAVVGDREGVEALVAGVLHLLDADRHGHVVGARRHGVGGLAERLGAGGAVVLDPGDRLALELRARASVMPLMPDWAVPSQ